MFAYDSVKGKRGEKLPGADMPEWIVRKAVDIAAERQAVEVLEEDEEDGDTSQSWSENVSKDLKTEVWHDEFLMVNIISLAFLARVN